MEIPPVRYAKSGNVSVAYQVSGEGNPVDLVFAPGTHSHLGLVWEEPRQVHTIERLSRFARLIRFEREPWALVRRPIARDDRRASIGEAEVQHIRYRFVRLPRSCRPDGGDGPPFEFSPFHGCL